MALTRGAGLSVGREGDVRQAVAGADVRARGAAAEVHAAKRRSRAWASGGEGRARELGRAGLTGPPEPLATQTHELKMKVAPLGGVVVLKAKVAIELTDELAESSTWRASYWCLPPSLLRNTLSSRVCR